jgi:hypothetical protein
MDISCAFPPVPETPEHIALAERLGYRRAWVYDTPALQLDVWATLARAAERTRRIELARSPSAWQTAHSLARLPFSTLSRTAGRVASRHEAALSSSGVGERPW